MNWYLAVLRKYADFSGRARRQEYWWFTLFNLLAYIIFGVLDGLTGTYDEQVGLGMISLVYALAILLPSLAVSVRRLHDTNRSGWWMLIVLIPIIGPLTLLVFMVLDGTQGENQYGLDPKLIDASQPDSLTQ